MKTYVADSVAFLYFLLDKLPYKADEVFGRQTLPMLRLFIVRSQIASSGSFEPKLSFPFPSLSFRF